MRIPSLEDRPIGDSTRDPFGTRVLQALHTAGWRSKSHHAEPVLGSDRHLNSPGRRAGALLRLGNPARADYACVSTSVDLLPMASSSVMYATNLSGPPHCRHLSASAWNTFAISRAQLGEQRVFFSGLSGSRPAPSSPAARSPRIRFA